MTNATLEQTREALALMNGEDHERAKGHAILARIKREIAKSYVREHDDHEAMRGRFAALADELEASAARMDAYDAAGDQSAEDAARIRDALAGGAS